MSALTVDLFTGIAVTDFAGAVDWYTRLFGAEPNFYATPTEAVWELAEHRWVYVRLRSGYAGYAMLTSLVEDLGSTVSAIAARGIEPDHTEVYDGGTRKVVYFDPEGNEFGFGELLRED